MRIVFQLLFRAPIRSDLDAEIDRPDLISFEAEIDVIRSAVPYLSKRVMHERALAGLTFITLQVAERGAHHRRRARASRRSTRKRSSPTSST